MHIETAAPPQIHSFGSRFGEALIRGFVWGIIGVVFGFLFVVLSVFFHAADPLSPGFLFTTAAAGGLGALIYGSMRLSIIVAVTVNTVAILYLLLGGDAIDLKWIALSGCLSGSLIGGIYGLRVKDSRVFRAEAKIIAGMVAGTIATLCLALPLLTVGQIPLFWTTMFLCPLTGLVYVSIVPGFVCRCCQLLAPVADGALVGGGVGAIIAVLFWIMVGSLHGNLAAAEQTFIQQTLLLLPDGVSGAVIGASSLGFLRTVAGAKWLDI